MHRPAGTNHHHAPSPSAWLLCAQNRIVPQFQVDSETTPTNDSVICSITAKITVPTKPDAITAVRFGSTSKTMIRQVRSPDARAASTKSRRRNDIVCARSTLAPHAHAVRLITAAISTVSADGSIDATMMINGSAGITRKTLDSIDNASSAAPPRNPAVTPIRMDRNVASTPHTSPTTITPLVPTSTCEKMSCPVIVVPNQCAADGADRTSSPISDGSYGAIQSPITAISAKKPRIPRPSLVLKFISPPAGCAGRAAGSRRPRAGSPPARPA